MPNATLPARPQLTRAQLSQAFKDPQVVLAFEQVLRTIGTPGSGTVNSTGEVVSFAGSAAPEGWLICDGSAVSRIAYPNLFAVIGTTWGAGDDVTSFNLPDMRGRTLIGASATYPLGRTGGSTTSVLTVDNLPAHNHDVTDDGHAHGITDDGHTHTAFVATASGELSLDAGQTGATAVNGSTGNSATGITINPAQTGITIQNTGLGEPFATLSPYAAVHYLIKT